jgi:hypothetical protein
MAESKSVFCEEHRTLWASLHPLTKGEPVSTPPSRKLLVALDGSDQAMAAVEYVAAVSPGTVLTSTFST